MIQRSLLRGRGTSIAEDIVSVYSIHTDAVLANICDVLNSGILSIENSDFVIYINVLPLL